MFDIGMPEMLVIAVVALVVVGPKDLPKVIRAIAGALGKVRSMAAEFRSGVNDFVRESELAELKEAIDKTRAAMDVPGNLEKFVDPTGTVRKTYEEASGKGNPTETATEEPKTPDTPKTDGASPKGDA
jgi:sec-independent protein translocase protein TatB